MLNKKDFQPLEQFVMDHCRDSIHFALQVYLLIRSMGDTGPEKWRKRCRKMLKKVCSAIRAYRSWSANQLCEGRDSHFDRGRDEGASETN